MSGGSDRLTIREGGPGDLPAVLRLFDEAVAWLVARGQTGQWGERPFSERPQNVERAAAWARGGGLRIAHLDGEPVGMIVLGDAYPWVRPVDEPELYVQALVTSRRHAGNAVGGTLLRRAFEEAGDRLVRVDCWAGAPRLVRWYEEQGFAKTDTFTVETPAGPWHGQVLARAAARRGS